MSKVTQAHYRLVEPCTIAFSLGFCDTTGAALSHEYWVEIDLAKQGNGK